MICRAHDATNKFYRISSPQSKNDCMSNVSSTQSTLQPECHRGAMYRLHSGPYSMYSYNKARAEVRWKLMCKYKLIGVDDSVF